jgi:ActR/RegA family two-component response regulator
LTPAPPVDVVLFGADWRTRAMARAQLIEEGYEVLATERWPDVRRWLRSIPQPRAAVVDLKGVKRPTDLLEDLRDLMNSNRVLILTGLATVGSHDVKRFGFRVLARPFSVGEVVAAVARLTGR